MNRQQTILVLFFVALFFTMYFGCDYVPKNHAKAEKTEKVSKEQIGDQKMIEEAKAVLSPEQLSNLGFLEQQIQSSESDTAKVTALKKLSGEWYKLKNSAISGIYARMVAEAEPTEKAWIIAGSMFQDGYLQAEGDDSRQYCSENAVMAFEKAVEINPENIDNRISLALCFTDNPPQDNPMKGILMLRELDSKYPSNPKVLFQLAKLAMRTNQFDKAIARLEQILNVQPGNASAICMLADAYKAGGKDDKAKLFAKKCESGLK